MSQSIYLLDEEPIFPPANLAQTEPNGLLAVGGDLSVERLTEAYRHGIFPWYSEDEPLLWWSPDPRAVFDLSLEQPIHISKSLKRTLKKQQYQVRLNQDFVKVIASCSMPRATQAETWILPEMQQAYYDLHQAGLAHSVEVYDLKKQLVGGLYGVSIGKFFFGESMFSLESNTSKIALVHLSDYLKGKGFELIDCQIPNPHLASLGALDMAREVFLSRLQKGTNWKQPDNLWQIGKQLELSK